MGLDMYLIKRKKKQKGDLWDFKDELVYWRKANAIHKYFCDIGKEIEEEQSYLIKKEDLENLVNLCDKLLKKVILKDGKVSVGKRYISENDCWEDMLEDGKIVINPEVCEELLPTESGFFFGSTDYDEYYIRQIERTKNEIEQVLKSTDFDKDDIYYLASW